jgi:FdrA protein
MVGNEARVKGELTASLTMARVTVDFVEVRRGAFFDSVTLMLASRDALAQAGVQAASALAATPLNIALLAEQGFELADAHAEDVVVAVRADDRAAVHAARAAVERRLSAPRSWRAAQAPPRSFRGAVRGRPELSVALVSVPGRHAATECAAALEAGLNVFCFSDGVSLADELALKRLALERGLLMMGPECGTAILDGVGLGFANLVERGPVGIVGASGSGIQALCCLLDAAGVGISHAIGVGGRDLDPEVGGLMATPAVELLAADPGTEAIALVGKGEAQAPALEEAAGGRPLITAIPGTGTLEETAGRLCELVGATPPTFAEELRTPPRPGVILGCFSGGTLCDEVGWLVGGGDHRFTDFGEATFTSGRPHPMIDPSLRAAYIEREAANENVSALVFDVVLGHGAHPDPAGALVAALKSALAGRDSPLSAIAAVCGTDRDPQGLAAQTQSLEAAGAVVTRSPAHAARLARQAVSA